MIPRQLSPRNDEGTTAPHCIHSECTRVYVRWARRGGLKLLFILYYYVVIKFVVVVPPSPVTHDAKNEKKFLLLQLLWDFQDSNIL